MRKQHTISSIETRTHVTELTGTPGGLTLQSGNGVYLRSVSKSSSNL